MSSVIVLIGTPDPDDWPFSSAEFMREYEREFRLYHECQKARWAIPWEEILNVARRIWAADDRYWDDGDGCCGA